MKHILITGAAGKIGNALRKGLRGNYPLVRLIDIVPLGPLEAGEEFFATDITHLRFRRSHVLHAQDRPDDSAALLPSSDDAD